MPEYGRIKRPLAASALQDPATFATTIALIAHDEWGTDWLGWHPETLVHEVLDTWGVTLSETSLARAMAASLVLTTDRFYKECAAFQACCSAFSGGLPSATLNEPLDAMECGWGITEALGLDALEADPSPFTEEIRRYIGVVLAYEGIFDPPDVLRVAILPRRPQYAGPEEPRLANAANQIARLRSEEITDAIRAGLKRLVTQQEALGLTEDAVSPVEPDFHQSPR